MKIATVVQGRIFGFDLARGLLANGEDALLLTNYPKWAVERFDVPARIVRSCWSHGVAVRVLSRCLGARAEMAEPMLHRWFGAWAARTLSNEPVDAVQIFSGVAEEAFLDFKEQRPEVKRMCIRASTHIKTQRRILAAEQKRLGTPVEQPSAWRIAREVREYQLAHKVMLLSGFTYRSFIDRGYAPDRLIHLPMGADVGSFVAAPEVVAARAARIERGDPLQVLIVGTWSARKGARDMLDVARELAPKGFKFRFIGAVAPDAAHLVSEARQFIEFAGFQPQAELPRWYAQADVFFFPTLEDGFPAVLAQALTGGLPLLTTPNSSAADLVREGVNGWLKPTRDARAFAAQLRWCDENRALFARMISAGTATSYQRDWPLVAAELVDHLKTISADQHDRLVMQASPAAGSRSVTPLSFHTPADPLRIAIVAHGRFHAFDLCRALQRRGDVDVTLLTNVLRSQVAPFGINPRSVDSLPMHRLAQKIFYHFEWLRHREELEPMLYRWFGTFALRNLSARQHLPQVIRVFSSVAEEMLRSEQLAGAVRIVTRGSSHIKVQRHLLDDEMERTGAPLLKPSDYLVAREMREYGLADCVQVLSSFAERTFLEQGHPADRLWKLPNAVNLGWYGVTSEIAAARRQRILAGEPLRVLMVGTFSYRKGAREFGQAASQLRGRCQFRFVGDITPAARPEADALRDVIEFVPRVSPLELKDEYAWGDVFLLPTLEDGFPATLTQALAGGLPAITTPNGSGPDLIREGGNGWIIPIRDAAAVIARIEWLLQNRPALLAAGAAAALSVGERTWDQVADEFVNGLHERWPRLRAGVR